MKTVRAGIAVKLNDNDCVVISRHTTEEVAKKALNLKTNYNKHSVDRFIITEIDSSVGIGDIIPIRPLVTVV